MAHGLTRSPQIFVIRETHEAPESVARALELAGGKNPFGEPNYRAVWGWNRLAWIGGKFEEHDPNTGSLLREVVELEAAREWFYDLHCTLRGFLFHNGNGFLAEWIDQYLDMLALDPKMIRDGRSLRYEGRLLSEAERKRLQEWEWVITERHRASIWLMGEYPFFTEVSVDT